MLKKRSKKFFNNIFFFVWDLIGKKVLIHKKKKNLYHRNLDFFYFSDVISNFLFIFDIINNFLIKN